MLILGLLLDEMRGELEKDQESSSRSSKKKLHERSFLRSSIALWKYGLTEQRI
jgi:hypothetical protein